MEINIKWNICRICLKESGTSGFQKGIYKTDSDRVPFHLKLSDCGGFEVKKGENLPDKMCDDCSTSLTKAYEFRQKCRASNEHLQTILLQTRSLSLIKPAKPAVITVKSDVEEEEQSSSPPVQNQPILEEEDEEVRNLDEVKMGSWGDEEPQDEDMQIEIDYTDEYQNFQQVEDSQNAVYTIVHEEETSTIDEFETEEKISLVYEDEEGTEEAVELEVDDAKTDIFEISDLDEKFVPEDTNQVTSSIAIQKIVKKMPAPGSFICEICGNSYPKKSQFTVHMKTHHNQNARPYECEICSKKFTMTCNLIAHIRTHTGEKPFKCQFCDRRFTNRSTHLKHERIHKNERPFVCGICSKAFTYSNGLKAHEKIHTGEKNYKCETCNKNFTLPHQLKAHLGTNAHKEAMKQENKSSDYFD